MRAKVLLADDHQIVAEGIGRILEREYELLDTAQTGPEMLQKVNMQHPDAVIMDVSMPGMNGIEVARRIHSDRPDVKIVFLSMHTDRIYVNEAFRAGGAAFVSKRVAGSELLRVLGEVMSGRTDITAGISAPKSSEPAGERALTPRQAEVLQCVARGFSAKEAATCLGVSPKTVEFHKARIMEKLGKRTTAELTRYALTVGLIEE